MTHKSIDQYAHDIHKQNKAVGWWDNPDECSYQKLQLVSTEIAEATEGERKNLMDDHLPHRKMGEVELADALIRTLDLAGRFGWLLNKNWVEYNSLVCKTSTIGKQHLGITIALAELAAHIHKCGGESIAIDAFYSTLINSILQCAKINNYDIFTAMDEKIEYNKHRQDHKRENRAKGEGKKF